MNALIDSWIAPGLSLLGDWSIRWALLIAILTIWFFVRSPRTAAVRLLACRLVLIGGIALPLMPRLWGPTTESLAWRAPDGTQLRDAQNQFPTIARQSRTEKIVRPLPSPTVFTDAAQTPQQQIDDFTAINPSVAATPRPIGILRGTLLLLAAAWLGCTVIQGARLVLGWIWLTRLRGTAGSVGDAAQAEFERYCLQLHVSRPVRLAAHPTVMAPILVGGLRPCVLVPPNWDEYSADSRRIVLLHELAHVIRRDDFAKLFEETVRACFFSTRSSIGC